MRTFVLLSLSLILFGASIPLAARTRAQGLPFPTNSSFFTGKPPNLNGAYSPFSSVNIPNVPYHFTISLPDTSVESLGQVTIEQETSTEVINFDLSQTQAFQGTPNNRGQTLILKNVTQDPETQTISVIFDPPVSPGTTFTISLIAEQNPSVGFTYLFRIKAFPAGNNPVGMDLGVGR
ncbi:MAG: DUF2808 domain-containing protein, partial [Snowella sp.]